jgi:exopolysaccharide biosynthesis polyprenyl glycosylphosphotransferase
MTPQLAARIRIEPGSAGIDANAAHGTIALPARRFRQIDGDQRSLPGLLRRESLHRRLLCAADILAATLALGIVMTLVGAGSAGALTLACISLIVVPFKLAGLYDRDQLRVVQSTLDETPLLLQLTGLYALIVSIVQPTLLTSTLEPAEIGVLWAATFAAVVSCRVLVRCVAAHTLMAERCLVIGKLEHADRIREKLRSKRVRAAVVATLPLVDEDLDRLDPEGIRTLVGELGVHRIIVAPSTGDSASVVELIRIAKAAGVQVSVLPRMLEVVGSSVEIEDIDGMTMLGVRPFGLSRSSRLIKRAFDFTLTSLGLVAVGPLILAIAVAIRIDSRGPVFFRQVRVGRDGRHFRIFKFRSMELDADARKDSLRAFNEVGDGMFKITSDPRVTRVGAFLRRTSLDELPQLFNVIHGEMSLVGPRPLVVDEDAQVLGLDRSRLHLTPGMTGPWQVLGSRVPMREMVGIDYLYVASWSLWLDVKVLLRTVHHIVRGGNV